MNERPIEHKYPKGKMQRTLKREFKELEVVEREAIAANCGTTGVEIVRSPVAPILPMARGRPTSKKSKQGNLCTST